ncbi:MAG: hypothetical protein NC043_05725 [Muribaculaceae bacterium]|nr:hypothetical protein [Muribaculaceae bacterium]
MKDISLEPIFLTVTADTAPLIELTRGDINMTELRHAVDSLPFNTVYDFIRTAARKLTLDGRVSEAIERITEFDIAAQRMAQESGKLLDIHAALMQTITALYIHAGKLDDAMVSAATTLNLLAQEPKRKDEPFLSVLASLLYDISLIHTSRGQYKQAEREIEKAMKIFERLAKISTERYGPAHLLAMNASTHIYRSRVKQAEMLASYQNSTNAYMRMVGEGIEDAGMRLVDSLAAEGRTLTQMCRQREAVQYFTRALKYLTKLEPEFSLKQLQLSIDLGEALLSVKGSREKGIHLLNTMLYKANKINAGDEHRRIVDILYNAKNSTMDIFGFWHKIFPR